MPTTPQHLAGIETLFPELAAYRRTATRLHPRPGAPAAHESNVGGPLLWPADEPWPVCDGPHEVAYLLYRLADVRAQRAGGPWPQEVEGPFPADTPVPLLSVAQFHRHDVPDFIGPAGADLAQVLWCPFDHEPEYAPAVSVHWRRSAEVTEILDAPEPEFVGTDDYVAAPCAVSPEQVTEYEYGHLLPPDLRARIEEWEAGTVTYGWGRSITQGWKVGGFASWTLSDPRDMTCDCGEPMRLLLKVCHGEWDGDRLWVPDDAGTTDAGPTGVTIGRGYGLWIWVCPADYRHPVQTSMQ